ncbi:MAG: ammonium transporter [Pseudomonadota bacterium]
MELTDLNELLPLLEQEGAATAAIGQELIRFRNDLNAVWLTVATALVFSMQGGFLLLEAGMVRSKNSINVAQKNLCDFVLASCGFYLFGFALMFGPSSSALFGDPFFSVADGDFPLLSFFAFQLVFCGTAATIVSGAVAERTPFYTYLIITVLVSTVVYPVFGHWAWGNLFFPENRAFLAERGFIDFAGSAVVHATGGWVALAAIIVIGPRRGKFGRSGLPRSIPGHNAVLMSLGAIILWVGWIGFNAGSSLVGSLDFARIISNTIIAGAFAGFAGLVVGWWVDARAQPDRTINGVLAGLVAITAGCDAVGTQAAIIIGLSAGVLVTISTNVIERVFKLDDVVGAVSVHGTCGVWGVLMAGVFAKEEKLLAGSRIDQILVQVEGAAIHFVWAFGVTLAVLSIIRMIIPLRVPMEVEERGLDLIEHGAKLERAR